MPDVSELACRVTSGDLLCPRERDSQMLEIATDADAFREHVHGRFCRTCCAVIEADLPVHPNGQGKREGTFELQPIVLKLEQEVPRRCETEFAHSIQGQAIARGNSLAPVCTDCHGIHTIQATTPAPETCEVVLFDGPPPS